MEVFIKQEFLEFIISTCILSFVFTLIFNADICLEIVGESIGFIFKRAKESVHWIWKKMHKKDDLIQRLPTHEPWGWTADEVSEALEWVAYEETSKYKAYEEAKEAFEATPEYKDWEEATKAVEETWGAVKETSEFKAFAVTAKHKPFKEAQKELDEAYEVVMATPEHKEYRKTMEALVAAWDAMWATPEYKAQNEIWNEIWEVK